MKSKACVSCGKDDLTRNEEGINKKLLGENAEYLEVTLQDIMDKIEEFKEDGCKFFEWEIEAEPMIYADNATTAALDIDAFRAMTPYLLKEYGSIVII